MVVEQFVTEDSGQPGEHRGAALVAVARLPRRNQTVLHEILGEMVVAEARGRIHRVRARATCTHR